MKEKPNLIKKMVAAESAWNNVWYLKKSCFLFVKKSDHSFLCLSDTIAGVSDSCRTTRTAALYIIQDF